jgi:hypothetical protein
MPAATCFNYLGNMPSSQQGGTNTACFSYSATARLDTVRRDAARPGPADFPSAPGGEPSFPGTGCFSYVGTHCFGYPDDLPRAGNSDAAQPYLPRLRRMPYGTCFRC